MTHPGVDIECSKGSEVRAIADGTIENVYVDDRLGVTIVISHANGMASVYSNLKAEPPVNIGDRITARHWLHRRHGNQRMRGAEPSAF